MYKSLTRFLSLLFQRKRLQLDGFDHHDDEEEDDSSSSSSNSLESRHRRSALLADWLVQRFDMSKPDHVVLDVAGGRKCDVGFELKIRRSEAVQAEVVCIDPRGQVGVGGIKRRTPKWKAKIMKKNKEEDSELKHLNEMFTEDLLDKMLRDDGGKEVRLILGMHPDEATEPIVDLALKHDLSFAIVPCCVFAHANPGRRMKSGQEPKTYEQFCDYLMEKDPEIRSESLGFRGRDKILYRLRT